MKLKNNKITKGIIFAGCSFTWGQGLYYYSNLKTITNPKLNIHKDSTIRSSHDMIRKTLYYPRLVANHFNTFEITMIQNGGTDYLSLEFINDALGLNNKPSILLNEVYSMDEIEYIIIQTSQIQRNRFKYIDDSIENIFRIDEKSTHEKFYNYLKKNNIEFNDWYSNFIKKCIEDIKISLEFYEKNGIKTLILCWPNDYIEHIKNDSFLNDRFVKIEYNNIEYDTITELIENHPHLQIKFDFENFIEPPEDLHPSKECHQLIAKSIIKRIEK
jgi:hypothetical protein